MNLDLLEVVTNLFAYGLVGHCISICEDTDVEIVARHFGEADDDRMDQGKYDVRDLRCLLTVLVVLSLEVRA